MGWVGISTHSFSGSTADAQVTPSLCFQSLAHLELDTAHTAGVHSCLWEWASVFLALHRDTIHRFVPTCKMQQTSPQVTELLHWFLFVLVEPQPLLELCCQMDFGGTFDSPPPRTPTARAELSQPGNHSTEQLLRDWSCISVGKLETPAIVFIF